MFDASPPATRGTIDYAADGSSATLDLPDCAGLKAGGSAYYEVSVGGDGDPVVNYEMYVMYGDAPFGDNALDDCFTAAAQACAAAGNLQAIADCVRQKTGARAVQTSPIAIRDTGNVLAKSVARGGFALQATGGILNFVALPAVGYNVATCGGKHMTDGALRRKAVIHSHGMQVVRPNFHPATWMWEPYSAGMS